MPGGQVVSPPGLPGLGGAGRAGSRVTASRKESPGLHVSSHDMPAMHPWNTRPAGAWIRPVGPLSAPSLVGSHCGAVGSQVGVPVYVGRAMVERSGVVGGRSGT